MSKEKELANPVQECVDAVETTVNEATLRLQVDALVAENETLKSEKAELENSKKFWVDRSYEYENKYKALVEQVKSVGVLVNGMVAA